MNMQNIETEKIDKKATKLNFREVTAKKAFWYAATLAFAITVIIALIYAIQTRISGLPNLNSSAYAIVGHMYDDAIRNFEFQSALRIALVLFAMCFGTGSFIMKLRSFKVQQGGV